MKRSLLWMGMAFAVTLAIVFGVRASADALAVVIGVFLGVLAGVPTTFLVTYIFMRLRPGQQAQPPPMAHQPPVVVINASDKTTSNGQPGQTLPLLGPTSGRKWTIIGDTEES